MEVYVTMASIYTRANLYTWEKMDKIIYGKLYTFWIYGGWADGWVWGFVVGGVWGL